MALQFWHRYTSYSLGEGWRLSEGRTQSRQGGEHDVAKPLMLASSRRVSRVRPTGS